MRARRDPDAYGPTLAVFLALAGIFTPMAEAADADAGVRLLQAAASGDLQEIRRLLAAGAPIDTRDGQGHTALLLAVDANHVRIAKALLDAGASVNAQAENLDTPWLLAGARGRIEIIAMLLPRTPDLTIRNRFGGNALIPACERRPCRSSAATAQGRHCARAARSPFTRPRKQPTTFAVTDTLNAILASARPD